MKNKASCGCESCAPCEDPEELCDDAAEELLVFVFVTLLLSKRAGDTSLTGGNIAAIKRLSWKYLCRQELFS
jgi:hypothetical protein